MIVDGLLRLARKNPAPLVQDSTRTEMTLPELTGMVGGLTAAGQVVTAETSRNVHTADRCINILSDDLAKMPLQTFLQRDGRIERMRPRMGYAPNLAWLLEVRPNRWMSPFVWKKTIMQWLICWGNAYVWQMPGLRELMILPSYLVTPGYDRDGNLWFVYQVWPVGTWLAGAVVAVILGFAIGGDR